MGKKSKKIPFLFKPSETTTSAAPWPWPACVNNPKTLSFRANPNSASLHDENPNSPQDYSFSANHDHHEQSFSYASEICFDEAMVITGLSSDRLFFEPGETSSILEVAKSYDFPYKRATITAMDSNDPFVDFRVSMAEMVEAHGLKDWDCLEELLTCYLTVNGKSNHGYIVEAFIDLLMNIALGSNDDSEISAIDEPCSSSATATTQYSFTSPLSFSSSTCSSSLENEDGIVVEKM